MRPTMKAFEMKRLAVILLAFAALGGATASTAAADEHVVSTALAHDGQLVSLLSGTYGELFPSGSEAQADVTVLALRRTQPDGQRLVEVVPATLDQDTEEAAELMVEPVSGVSYIFWQSWTNQIHSRFRVSSFDGETWGEPIDVSGAIFALRTSPAFAVTRDSFTDIAVEGEKRVTRTVLHIVWSEEGVGNRWDTKYAPLVLEDGEYIGQHPVLVLNELVQGEPAGAGSNLRVAPVLRSRDGENGVVVAFLDQASGQVAAVELRFAAGELSILGDTVAAEVEEGAPAAADAAGVDRLVGAIRTRLLGYADHLKPEILNPLASDLERHLRERLPKGSTSVGSVRDGARAQLIDVGFRLTDGRVRRASGDARAQLIDVGARSDGPRRSHRHDARSTMVSNRRIPNLSSTPEILVSRQGGTLILAWSDAERVHYQESTSDSGWSAVQQIRLTDQIDRAKALAILQARVDQQ